MLIMDRTAWGSRLTLAEEIREITLVLTQFAAVIPAEVLHKYDGNSLPYRWEIRSSDLRGYRGTVSLDAPNILHMQILSENDRRDFLHSLFSNALVN